MDIIKDTNTDGIAWRLGDFGVYIFFIISGFVITFANSKNYGKGKSGQFFTKRLIRILPLYWIVTFIYIGKLFLASANPGFVSVLASIFFIPYGCFYEQCGRPLFELGWTLQFEMFFYLLFAGALLLKRLPAIIILLSILLLVVVVSLFGLQIPLPIGYYFSPILVYFISGVLLGLFVRTKGYRVLNELASKINIKTYGVILLLTLGASVYFITLYSGVWLEPAVFLLANLFVFLCLRKVSRPSIDSDSAFNKIFDFLVLLGSASYSIYLTHIFTLSAGKRLVGYLDLQLSFSTYLTVLVCLSSLIAVMSYKFIEKPSQKFLARLIANDK